MTGGARPVPEMRDHIAGAVRSVLTSGGEPLSAETRADLEPRFGADLSAVRVHADEAAGTSSRQLSASAYTAGQHVVFGAGRYAPRTADGRALLAHEVAHTIQQRHVGPDGHAAAVTSGAIASLGPEQAARHAAAQALAGPAPDATPASRPDATPAIAPAPAVIAREEGTAEIVDRVPPIPELDLDRIGLAFTGTVRRDQYKTRAQAQRAQASNELPETLPGYMDTGYARISFDAVTGELTVPVTVDARHATDADIKRGDPDKPDKLSPKDITSAQVQHIADTFITEVNTGLNDWFTLYVPPCRGFSWSGRELKINVRVTKAAKPDFTIAVSQHAGRSFVAHDSPHLVLLYAGGLDALTMRHEGTHLALGFPDEYKETDEKRRRDAPAQTSEERQRYDWPLSGDDDSYGVFSMLHERHFSFVPAFVHQVLTSLGHPECVPVLHEGSRPRPRLLRISATLFGLSDYAGGSYHAEAGVDHGWMLDRERSWRAFLGVHGHAFVGDRSAFLLGARLGFERKWRSARLGPVAEAYTEGGVATETGAISGPSRGAAPFAGVGASVGLSGWTGSGEWEVKLTGGEVVRLDAEKYHAFQAGLLLSYSFWGGVR